MQTLEGLQKRIRTASDLLTVVKTMKSLAAVNIRHFEGAAAAIDRFNEVVDQGWQALSRLNPLFLRQLPGTGVPKRWLLLFFGSVQGMCGQYNEALIRFGTTEAERLRATGAEVTLWVVGDKLLAGLEDEGWQISAAYDQPGGLAGIGPEVERIVARLEEEFREAPGTGFQVVHHRLDRGARYEPVSRQLFPLDRAWLGERHRKPWPGRCLPRLGADQALLFGHLFRQFLLGNLYQAFAQALASENGARLAAMQAAEKNILDREEELLALFRETRQSVITAELFDIVSGFEALADEASGPPSEAEDAPDGQYLSDDNLHP